MSTQTRITVTLNERIMEELLKLTEESSKTAAVNAAVSEWVNYKKRQQLIGLAGKLKIESPKKAKQAEIKRLKDLH